jgi:hypothetical protein
VTAATRLICFRLLSKNEEAHSYSTTRRSRRSNERSNSAQIGSSRWSTATEATEGPQQAAGVAAPTANATNGAPLADGVKKKRRRGGRGRNKKASPRQRADDAGGGAESASIWTTTMTTMMAMMAMTTILRVIADLKLCLLRCRLLLPSSAVSVAVNNVRPCASFTHHGQYSFALDND